MDTDQNSAEAPRLNIFQRLISPRFRIGRLEFLLSGVLAFTVKFALDSILALFFNRVWSLANYLEPSRYYSIWSVPSHEWPFYIMLVLLSMPFMVLGMLLTLGRLRDAKLPLWLSLLFFLPLVNLIFFIVISAVPTAHENDPNLTPNQPKIQTQSQVLPALIASLFGLLMGVFAIAFIETYGWGLFIGIPVAQGFVAAILCRGDDSISLSRQIRAALFSGFLTGCGILIFQIDGLICLIMALPLVIPALCLGAFLGHLACPGKEVANYCALAVWILAPGLLTMESIATPNLPLHAVTTEIIVDAPPEIVWNNVVVFPDLDPPTEPLFRTGIAYPLRATIQGEGVGAIRYCEFSTGPFVEPITVWDPPYHLAFDVTAQPAPMEELTIFANTIHPPHLDDMLFISHRGEFRLSPLPGGKTLMQGTTWYTNGMWPTLYWKQWSNWIIQKIHLRVLNHIKIQAETIS